MTVIRSPEIFIAVPGTSSGGWGVIGEAAAFGKGVWSRAAGGQAPHA